MERNPALEADIDVEQRDADDVKGGGIIDATATVAGTTVTASDSSGVSASGSGLNAGASTSGAHAGATGAGVDVKAGAKSPRVKPRHRHLLP